MLRSIQKCVEEITAMDPNTSLTTCTIRQWCKEGKIKHLLTGNKILVVFEDLLDYINCGYSTDKQEDK